MDKGNQKIERGNGWLYALLSCLGVVITALTIVGVIIIFLFIAIDDEIDEKEELHKERKQISNNIYKLGDTVEDDGVEITLVKAEFVKPTDDLDFPPNNGKALKVYFKFKNNNDAQVRIQNDGFTMKVNGENYQEWFGNSDRAVGFSHQLNKDNTGSGYIVYDVPDNDKYTLEMNFMPNIEPTQAKWEINSSSISTVNNTSNKYTVESSDIKP
ncbi:DUF4352 domain-containing protein [Mammaliicoccus sciuri]|uniref:DUF4352 domain-containing protein n=1 Tax=Mammaliicoccus sciuri TaxID=1296 RepID=UPI000D1F5A39|nr:DUF4352 domain-containing protein [Mammaliicoccus sciuri]MDT0696060.1 DUF4352 domain-containing protein [Mammaliicoccus sciuri]PTJ46647.1 hypothetical protein BU012_13620 [Mammaliicoccus sciuri]